MGDNVWELKDGFIAEKKTSNVDPDTMESETFVDARELTPLHSETVEVCSLPVKEQCVKVSIGDEASPKNGKIGSNKFGSTHCLKNIDGPVISFKNINYEVKAAGKSSSRSGCCGDKQMQKIINNVSGIFRPGVNAILGPTGSGKTSLLDILAGRKNPNGLSGSILVDGYTQPSNFKCMAGYVIQDDIVMGMLTVRENINFSAALRLPSKTSAQQRKDRVEEIIVDLGLEKCADTKVGTEFVRGVSGGERKRTNIAMELITSPRVLFLDEPTTGLDAYTAHSVMYLLQRLSRRGMTIIFSIHQPRYSIYKLFDVLLLISSGECVYHGPAREGLDFFSSANYICEEHNNPSDFFLDVLSGSISPLPAVNSDGVNKDTNGLFKVPLDEHEVLVEIEASDHQLDTERQHSLVKLYEQSKWYTAIEFEHSGIINGGEKKDISVTLSPAKLAYPTSFGKQLLTVSSRTWNNMVRNRHALLTQIFSGIILGLIVGSIYFQIDSSPHSRISNRVGAFFFIVMNFVFGNMSAVDIFIKERAIFIHETISGYYRVSAYFFAKIFCDVLPQRVFPIIFFAVITYFMIGFQVSADKMLFYLLNIILTSLAGTSVALCFSASTRQHTIGTIFTALVWVVMMVYSGVLVNIETIPRWLQWINWLSIFRYSINGFVVNEISGMTFCDQPIESIINGTVSITNGTCTSGGTYLTEQGINHETAWDLWSNELALSLITLFFLVITYVQLRRTATLK